MRAILVFGAGVILRLALIARFPLIFGGDPMLRMLHRDQILLSHQLPLLQAIVYLIARVTHAYVVTQGVMAIIGAAAGVGFYLLARDLVEEPAAFLAALLLTTNPFITALSIVPFQESLMLAMLFFAFHYFYADRPLWASFFLALACFTRFEAWAAAPVLAAAYIWKHGIKPSFVLRGLALFGSAPVAWIIFQRGLAPAGSYVVEAHVTAMRLIRWVYLGYITLKFTPVIVIALGSFGCWLLWRDRRQWLSRIWPLPLFFGLFLVALLFSAHGDWPDPERRVASRSAPVDCGGRYAGRNRAPETAPVSRRPRSDRHPVRHLGFVSLCTARSGGPASPSELPSGEVSRYCAGTWPAGADSCASLAQPHLRFLSATSP